MAADIGGLGSSERKRKRKKPLNHPKLLVNDKVEVRSVDEGFRGSWHSATVISCENRSRIVKYDHLLSEDGSQCLIEGVKVPPILDGIIPASRDLCNYRGLIRPLPPQHNLQNWSFRYGRCVDVYFEEAWWEGVIFDHKDGSEERTIFFPDMGDEMPVGTDNLRVTCDWDEFTEEWRPRGKWLFLDLIEEFEREWPLQVSVRQIWYEVRGKKGFQKLVEWTSTNTSIWKVLMWEVILDNCHLMVDHFFRELDSLEELDLGNSLAVVPFENDALDSSLLPTDHGNATNTNLLTCSNMPCHEETPCLPFNRNKFSGLYLNLNSKGFSSPISQTAGGKFKHQKKIKKFVWLPAGIDIVPRAEFHPDLVNEYRLVGHLRNKRVQSMKVNVRCHLAYLGWKIEVVRDNGTPRMRYTSTDGKQYFSLVKVCEALCEPSLEVVPFASQDDKRISETRLASRISEPPHGRMEVSVSPPPSDIVVEAEYCPQAVIDYYFIGSEGESNNMNCYKHSDSKKVNDLKLKAKKHLSFDGWSFWYTVRAGKKRELRYISPRGRSYNSLRAACKSYIDGGGANDSNAFTSMPRQITNVSQILSSDMESHEDSISTELVELRKPSVKGIKKRGRKRKTSGSLTKVRDDLGNVCSARVLRSSKRARQMASPSACYQNPRTILSWLIDNNVVLPRAKVRYVSRKDNCPMAEGRITREGIRCGCCQHVFTLSKFEAHAGSTNHRPAANIFLEDGRSLLDCQSELKSNHSKRNLMTEPHKTNGRRDVSSNDYLCSVCHFGGELVLCDQCPSSFHTGCLGMKDVPDGDWFCPSCCCGICGTSRLNKDPGQFTDGSVLSCDQCEHQYHVGCLRKRGVANVDMYPKGIWFCCTRCKEISSGLQKLLGKSVPVGVDNLTWTLLKYVKHDDDDVDRDGYDMEALTENYSKLNVALSVMHECFEPVKEPRTKRDLVEDVIFSRWSELNRLNFRGFYTVLLERNDELVTAATIRVHGEKVAEVPLVGTRFKYRRLGMCRILMNELEKKLMELGVERLVLPAVPTVLNTWTTSFGFSQMTSSERLNFLDCTFLDFQGTIMCQKLLRKKIPSTDLRLIIRTQQNIHDVSGIDKMDLEGNGSGISEAFQVEKVEKSEVVDQEPACIAGDDGSDGGSSGTTPPVFEVNHPNVERFIPSQDGHKECENDDNGLLKCYKRRRLISGC